MAQSVDHDQSALSGFMWENQQWSDLTNSKNLGESRKQKLDVKLLNHKEGVNEGEVPVNKKRSRGGVVIRSEDGVTNGEGKDGKYRDSDHEMHILTERERRKKMRNMFSSLHALLPELSSKIIRGLSLENRRNKKNKNVRKTIRADKSTIVDAAVKKIKNLRQILENLEKKKQEKLNYASLFASESSYVINKSQWLPYESRETVIADQGPLSYNNNLPSSVIATSYPNSNASSLYAPPPQQVVFQTWYYHNVVLNICGGEAQFSICAANMSGLLTIVALVFEKHMIDVVSANIMCNGNGNFYMILAHARQCSPNTISLEESYKQAAGEIMMQIS